MLQNALILYYELLRGYNEEYRDVCYEPSTLKMIKKQ
jgi:hypothetical protein